MDKFIQNLYTFEYSRNQSVDTAIARTNKRMIIRLSFLNQKNGEDEEREKIQLDKIDLEIDKDIPVPIIIN